MAKRVAQKIKRVQNAKPVSTAATKTGLKRFDLGKLNLSLRGRTLPAGLKAVIVAPATMYIAGGVGVALLARFAFKYYKSHPEISDFVEEKIETVEEKLKEYRSNLISSSESDEATH